MPKTYYEYNNLTEIELELETWFPILTCKDLLGWDVSDMGRVKSARGKIMHVGWNNNSLAFIASTGRNSQSKKLRVFQLGRIICEVFHGIPHIRQYAVTIDGDPTHLIPENLMWWRCPRHTFTALDVEKFQNNSPYFKDRE